MPKKRLTKPTIKAARFTTPHETLWQETKFAVAPVTISFSLVFVRTLVMAYRSLNTSPDQSLFFTFPDKTINGVYALGGQYLESLQSTALLLLTGLPIIITLWLLQTSHLERYSIHYLAKKLVLNLAVVFPLLSAIMAMSFYLLANVIGRIIYVLAAH